MMIETKRILEFLVNFLDVEEEQITPEATIKKDLWADAEDFSQLILGLEKEFNIKIDSIFESKLITIKDIYTYIENYETDPTNQLNRSHFKV